MGASWLARLPTVTCEENPAAETEDVELVVCEQLHQLLCAAGRVQDRLVGRLLRPGEFQTGAAVRSLGVGAAGARHGVGGGGRWDAELLALEVVLIVHSLVPRSRPVLATAFKLKNCNGTLGFGAQILKHRTVFPRLVVACGIIKGINSQGAHAHPLLDEVEGLHGGGVVGLIVVLHRLLHALPYYLVVGRCLEVDHDAHCDLDEEDDEKEGEELHMLHCYKRVEPVQQRLTDPNIQGDSFQAPQQPRNPAQGAVHTTGLKAVKSG